jgi:hypothetical protein
VPSALTSTRGGTLARSRDCTAAFGVNSGMVTLPASSSVRVSAPSPVTFMPNTSADSLLTRISRGSAWKLNSDCSARSPSSPAATPSGGCQSSSSNTAASGARVTFTVPANVGFSSSVLPSSVQSARTPAVSVESPSTRSVCAPRSNTTPVAVALSARAGAPPPGCTLAVTTTSRALTEPFASTAVVALAVTSAVRPVISFLNFSAASTATGSVLPIDPVETSRSLTV